MGLFNRKSKKVNLSNNNKPKDVTIKWQAYGSPLVKIGGGDVTKPYINSSGTSDVNYVPFGWDNLYPQLIDQMYYQSPLHSSIIDFQVQSAVGGGYDIIRPTTKTGGDKVDELSFYKQVKIKKLLKGIAFDLKMHKRVHFKITKHKGQIIKIERVQPSKVRYNKSMTKYWISDDWMSNREIKQYDEYDAEFTEDKVTQIHSYVDLESSPGQDVYPLDKTISIFNWCYLDGQSANLQKDNIQKSIFGSLVIKRPNEFKSEEEFNEFKKSIITKEGDVVPVLLLTADGKDNLPEVENFPANQNDKAFEGMDKRIDDKICQGHSINPAIVGIERPGALGQGSDIKESYPIWIASVLNPFKEQIEEIIDELLYIKNIVGNFKLEEYKMIDVDKIEDKNNIKTNCILFNRTKN